MYDSLMESEESRRERLRHRNQCNKDRRAAKSVQHGGMVNETKSKG